MPNCSWTPQPRCIRGSGRDRILILADRTRAGGLGVGETATEQFGAKVRQRPELHTIIGTGNVGTALARHFSRAGIEVSIANTRRRWARS